jgi:hypothetical protein
MQRVQELPLLRTLRERRRDMRRLPIGNAKYWELVADKLSKAGWNWCCVSPIDFNGRTD